MENVHVGDRVLLVVGGVSVFEVRDVLDPQHALVESVEEDAPGRYPFLARIVDLVPADPE
ncbi:hypothetical protein [Nocardia cyriacigeorgica]|uniref:Uncharacterized protein n=1 Tax=Nocardia cyriacigeorgica TaxID=135487 RepID=A0A6P1DBR2_9NOCA|nr:hypothetical protein [Nocardia cyriacigeorgica]NEW42509.1 hypothetical protein [Nocardia cyriacigeorgica]NEW48195.1 hypothetical protein [Nocardia cyriacigeorgica]